MRVKKNKRGNYTDRHRKMKKHRQVGRNIEHVRGIEKQINRNK